MVDITDPQVILFSNEQIRPIAEKLRDLDALIDDLTGVWFGSISGIVSGNDNADPIIDGRAAEGISQLAKADIVNLITQCQTIQTQFDGGGVMDVIRKPTVRALTIG